METFATAEAGLEKHDGEGRLMPSGDAQRVWFTEMLDELERTWSKAMTWRQLTDFCHRMTVMRRDLREARGIKPPRFRCPKCGRVTRSDIRGISIRSALFALRNGGIITDAEFKDLDRRWKKYKAEHDLDPYGRAAEAGDGDVR